MRFVLIGLNLLIYGGLTFVGAILSLSVVSQHVPGRPSVVQLTYYLAFPIAVVALALCALLWPRLRRARWVAFPLLVPLLLLFPYLLAYTGGV